MKAHLAHMIRDRAARFGSKEVFRYRDAGTKTYNSYTWTMFRQEADKVSRSLIAMNFSHNAHIGIFSDNRLEWTLTDIGILGIRGVVVPFFGTASLSDVEYIVDETEMQLVFVGNQDQLDKALKVFDHSTTLKKIVIFPGNARSEDDRCITWETFLKLGEDQRFHEELEQLYEQAQPTDLATIIYTSGTTGEPKGVMLGHDNFMESFQLHDQRLDITQNDVSLCFLPLSHVFERTWTYYLMHCAAVNIFLENPKEVINTLPIANPTVMCTVPRFFEKTYDGIQAEAAKWPKIKKQIFDWAIRVGLQCNEFRKNSHKIPFFLNLKNKLADKLVFTKLRLVFGRNMRQMPCAGAAIREDLLRFFHATGLFVNYGYGTTETTATVSCLKRNLYEYESCGSIMPGLEVKFNQEGEIMVKGPTVFRGYFKKPQETSRSLVDGWYMTGDQGNLTNKGNLVMNDRLKDLFKTSVGKYVSPQKLELLLGKDQLIEQVIVVGDNRKFVSALIVPSFENLKTHAGDLGLDPDNREELVRHEAINKIFREKIETAMEPVTPYERVVRFILLAEPFSIENSAMTSTLKLRRRIIESKYKKQIELIYSAD